MKLNITRGRVAEPQKIVIYGPQGTGKTTLAAVLPSPLFLDTERGTRRMDVARLNVPTLAEFDSALKALCSAPAEEFQTIVVDTIDWLESRIKDLVVSTVSAKERSYGREESFIADHLQERIERLSALIDRGYNVCLLAHSALVNVDLPDQPVAYQRYELDMGKKYCAPLVKHWADHLLFLKPKLTVREPEEGKNKGIGNGVRLLCLSQTAAYDAKSRSSLTGEREISNPPTDALLRQIFADVGAPWRAVHTTLGAGAASAVTSAPDGPNSDAVKVGTPLPAAPPLNPAPAPQYADRVTPDGHPDEIPATRGQPPERPDLLPGLPLAPEQEELIRILAPHADAATAWLLKHNRINGGQTYVDMDDGTRGRVLKNPATFIKTITAAA